MKHFVWLIMLLLITSCKKDDLIVNGLVPVYFDALDFSEIDSQEPRAIIKQGKFVKVGNFLFVNDIKIGIHVIDNTNPNQPEYVYFWRIPGNQNFTIEGSFLYADNGPHLLVINIEDYANIQFVKYIENTFYENLLEQFPDEPAEYFECPDPSKGLVKYWKRAEIVNPTCLKI
ncbi:hypothetical protein GCM10007940_33290 [Portibacter lacus]|uniref:Uncharacterized protein n=2 Tax=Portibacter lacus TaxID=1099794 RepID=A0AA37SQ24_9BACT|nr:hypothetical protein GCM10007940_33290 [Portibacter lacus]